jgi:hypothetical protein
MEGKEEVISTILTSVAAILLSLGALEFWTIDKRLRKLEEHQRCPDCGKQITTEEHCHGIKKQPWKI